MNSNITKTVLGGLLPFITNPATLAIIGIGAVGLTVYDILTDKKEDKGNGSEPRNNGSEPLIEPLSDNLAEVAGTVLPTLETDCSIAISAVHSTDKEPLPAVDTDRQEGELETPNTEAEKKELIRRAMSELGKRSAAVRAKKKEN
tara:strand:+ start:204 stop:638 length:435 start_codon:yes stop_codon:yes gene_type:complete